MANSNNTNANSGSNLLSPNDAVNCGAPNNQQQQQQSPQFQGRRKSTLSGHGFFIDYSNTRRRSSTAARDHRLILARNNQVLRNYVSPTRWARGEKQAANMSGNIINTSNSSTRATSRQSRASCSAATGSPLLLLHGPSNYLANQRHSSVSVTQTHSGGRHHSQSALLLPSLHVPSALVGSRKTSIFDPTGHSVAPHIIARRKSTMVCGAGSHSMSTGALVGGQTLAPPKLVEPHNKSNWAGGRGKRELAQHVPVIGCSPTSIQASLAALEERRKYEKLLKRLRKHKKRKEKQRIKRREARLRQLQQYDDHEFEGQIELNKCDNDNQDQEEEEVRVKGASENVNERVRLKKGKEGDDREGGGMEKKKNKNKKQTQNIQRQEQEQVEEHEWRPTASLRRKSLRAIQNAADLLSGNYGHKHRHAHHDTMDGLSISTMSFVSTQSSASSCCSLESFEDEYDNDDRDIVDDEADYDAYNEDNINSSSASHAIVTARDVSQSREAIIDSSKSMERTKSTSGLVQPEITATTTATTTTTTTKKSLVRSAMRRIAATISGSASQLNFATNQQPVSSGATGASGSQGKQQQQQLRTRRRKSKAKTTRSASLAGGMNYWYYYYCYLRENSFDAAIDDLPISASVASEGPMTDAERRARLYINYSLARIEILNSQSDPVARLASKLAQADEKTNQFFASGANLQLATSNNGQATATTTTNNQTTPATNQLAYRSATMSQSNPAMASPISGLFDFSQSTDVSLTLSTSTMASSSTSRNSSSISSMVSLTDDSSDDRIQHIVGRGKLTVAVSENLGHFGRQRQQQQQQQQQLLLQKQQHQSSSSKRYVSSCDKLNLPPEVSVSQPNSPQHSSMSSTRSSLAVASISQHQQVVANLTQQQTSANRLSVESSSASDSLDYKTGTVTLTSSQSFRRNRAQKMSNPSEQNSNGNNNFRSIGKETKQRASNSNILSETSQLIGGQTRAITRHSHSNLSAESSNSTFSNVPLPKATTSTSISDTKRSASFVSNQSIKNAPISGISNYYMSEQKTTNHPSERQVEDNEEELDDFERLNRCHKPQKQQQQQPPPKREQNSNNNKQRRKFSSVRPSVSGSVYSNSSSTISERNSNFRMSVRSTRDYPDSATWLASGRSVRKSTRNSSLSWDTLNASTTTTNITAINKDPANILWSQASPLLTSNKKRLASDDNASSSSTTRSRSSIMVPAEVCVDSTSSPTAMIKYGQFPMESSNSSAIRQLGSSSHSQTTPNGSLRNLPSAPILTSDSFATNINGHRHIAISQNSATGNCQLMQTSGYDLNCATNLSGSLANDNNANYQSDQTQMPIQMHQCGLTPDNDRVCCQCCCREAVGGDNNGNNHTSQVSSSSDKVGFARCDRRDYNDTTNNDHYYQQQQQRQQQCCSFDCDNQTLMLKQELVGANGQLLQRQQLESNHNLADSTRPQQQQQQQHQQLFYNPDNGSRCNLPKANNNQVYLEERRYFQSAPTSSGFPMLDDSSSLSHQPARVGSIKRQINSRTNTQTGANFVAADIDDQTNLKSFTSGAGSHTELELGDSSNNNTIRRVNSGRGRSKQQQLELEHQEQITSNFSDAEAAKLIRSDGLVASGSVTEVEQRARAQSTGTGSANTQALRIAASYARVQSDIQSNKNSATSCANDAVPNSDNLRPTKHSEGRQTNLDNSNSSAKRAINSNSNLSPANVDDNYALTTGNESNKGQQQIDSNQPDDSLSNQEQIVVDLLNKNFFTCTLIGARQTGKRTIVKCFVKILNEFKIAADEYKKEKMLAKLMDCSEKLQDLTNQQAEPSDQNEPNMMPRSRINSWFSGISMNKLVGANKRRLHSTVGISLHPPQSDDQQQQQQRRHTAIDSTFNQERGFSQDNYDASTSAAAAASATGTILRYGNFLSPDGGIGNQAQNYNKSDTNISYKSAEKDDAAAEDNESILMTQLKVPNLSERKVSDAGSSSGAPINNYLRPRPSSGSVCFPDHLGDAENEGNYRTTRNSTQWASSVGRQSISSQYRRKRRKMVSLKDLNRRRCRIKFKTRRQTSESLLIDVKNLTPLEQEERQRIVQQNLADSFFVVYAINDRDSFDYAKKIIAQLRLIKNDVPLPIVLVANKIDLERAKVVKSEEGRLLAKKHACKFIEISCTVGFNLDNLLVGLRTQLILKHHVALNSIMRGGKQPKSGFTNKPSNGQANKSEATDKSKGNDNIIIRFYKKYVMDNYEQNYDCDNFSKL